MCHGFWVGDNDILHNQELHRRLWLWGHTFHGGSEGPSTRNRRPTSGHVMPKPHTNWSSSNACYLILYVDPHNHLRTPPKCLSTGSCRLRMKGKPTDSGCQRKSHMEEDKIASSPKGVLVSGKLNTPPNSHRRAA